MKLPTHWIQKRRRLRGWTTQSTSENTHHIVTRNEYNVPILNTVEAFFIGDVVHEDETHGPTVVRCCDCTVALLTRCVLKMENNMM